MTSNESLVHQFYTAFSKKDYATMQSLYAGEATFSDPVFQNLNAREVRAMWEMLCKNGKDLELTFSDIREKEGMVTCQWEAKYTFSKTGRKVHNKIKAEMRFQNGKIVQHTDHFNFWRWSRMALGTIGLLFGWTHLLRGKVRAMAWKSLNEFMR